MSFKQADEFIREIREASSRLEVQRVLNEMTAVACTNNYPYTLAEMEAAQDAASERNADLPPMEFQKRQPSLSGRPLGRASSDRGSAT